MLDSSTIQQLHDTAAPANAGTKASTLAELARSGETVPAGFVIPVQIARSLDANDLAPSIEAALIEMGKGRVAVRSSGLVEDLENESHAGQYLSILDVPSDVGSVIGAARRVVASANGSPMAVLVQAMVDATTAGAAFSANPVTGDPEVIVSAVEGLADRLMEGSVTGDVWVVRDDAAHHMGGGDTDSALVLEVAVLAQRLEGRQGHPVDIEWAYDGETLYLLQCRPITALPVRPDLTLPEGSWQKDTTHHPVPLLPLTASLASKEAEAASGWFEPFGLVVDRIEQVTVGGEIYVRVVPVGGGSGKPPPRIVMGLVARLHPGLRARMANAKRVIELGIIEDAPRRWEEEWKPELEASIARYRTVDLALFDDGKLLSHIDDLFTFAEHSIEIHFDLFPPYFVAIHEFVAAATDMLGWDENRVLRLLSGHSPASSEPTVAMRRVAEAIRRSPVAMASLDGPDGNLVARVTAADPDCGAAIRDWVDTYGFRNSRYDWSSPTIGEQPSLIAQMIRAEVDNETSLLNHDGVEAEARAALNASDTASFEVLMARARAVYPVREDSVPLTYSAQGALLRRAYLEVGARLAKHGVISDAEDVFYLEQAEVPTALMDDRHGSLVDLVQRRRAERAWVETHPGPAFLGDPPGSPPDISAFPEAGRRLNEGLLWMVEREFGAPPEPSGADGIIGGTPGAAGIHTGVARIVRSEADFANVQPGDVVICPITNPAWSVLFGIAGAFVCDAGGPLSHTAVLTREYDIPSVLATADASQRIRDGATVTVDGARGTVTPISSLV